MFRGSVIWNIPTHTHFFKMLHVYLLKVVIYGVSKTQNYLWALIDLASLALKSNCLPKTCLHPLFSVFSVIAWYMLFSME